VSASASPDREGPGAGLPQIRQIVLTGGSLVGQSLGEARTRERLPQIRQIVLTGGSLVGQSLGEARTRERFGVTVVRVTRATGEEVLNPTADTVLREGDRLRLFGLPRQIDALLQPRPHPSL